MPGVGAAQYREKRAMGRFRDDVLDTIGKYRLEEAS